MIAILEDTQDRIDRLKAFVADASEPSAPICPQALTDRTYQDRAVACLKEASHDGAKLRNPLEFAISLAK
jgi:hypothetical protein